MKKFLGVLALILGFAFQSNAQGAIHFKSEKHDFGKIVEGTQASYSFEFTNTGDMPLIIKDAKSSCGCTVPTKPTEPIAPGKTGVIEVQYNMNPGPISKTITVDTNAVNKENGMVALRIKGTVLVKEEKSILEKKSAGPLSK